MSNSQFYLMDITTGNHDMPTGNECIWYAVVIALCLQAIVEYNLHTLPTFFGDFRIHVRKFAGQLIVCFLMWPVVVVVGYIRGAPAHRSPLAVSQLLPAGVTHTLSSNLFRNPGLGTRYYSLPPPPPPLYQYSQYLPIFVIWFANGCNSID